MTQDFFVSLFIGSYGVDTSIIAGELASTKSLFKGVLVAVDALTIGVVWDSNATVEMKGFLVSLCFLPCHFNTVESVIPGLPKLVSYL